MSLLDLLNITCNIQSRTETQGAFGDVSNDWFNVYEDVPCHIQPYSGEPIELENGVQATIIDFIIYFSPEQNIAGSHQIIIRNKIYKVVGVVQDSRQTYKKAYVRFIDFNKVLFSVNTKELPMAYNVVMPTTIQKSLTYRTSNQGGQGGGGGGPSP